MTLEKLKSLESLLKLCDRWDSLQNLFNSTLRKEEVRDNLMFNYQTGIGLTSLAPEQQQEIMTSYPFQKK